MLDKVQVARNNLNSYFDNNYVELVDPENRSAGRKTYIGKNAKADYQRLIDNRHKNFNAYYIYKQIVSLKNMGYWNSLVSKVNMTKRMLQLEGGQIHYLVWQSKLYIEKIVVQKDYNFGANDQKAVAGIYQVKNQKKGNKDWYPVEKSEGVASSKTVVNVKNLAINGMCEGIVDAANYMPNFIRYGHGEASLRDTYALFFNPHIEKFVSPSNDWKSFKNSTGFKGGTQAAKKLAHVLMQSKGKDINITIQGDGHGLFRQALRIVAENNSQLEDMTVFYANATQNLNWVDSWRKKVGMKLAQKAPLINSTNMRQYLISGNAISQPIVGGQATPEDRTSITIGAVGGALGMVGLGSIGSGMVGAAGWALGAAPLLLGQSEALNKQVIDTPAKAVQQGARHYKKVVWDPIHKMMVRS